MLSLLLKISVRKVCQYREQKVLSGGHAIIVVGGKFMNFKLLYIFIEICSLVRLVPVAHGSVCPGGATVSALGGTARSG
jgi:hypothetical protein